MIAGSENVFVVPSVTSKTVSRDIVTPQKISVMLLIKEHCRMKDKYNLPGYEAANENALAQFSKRFCLIALQLIQSPDLDFNSLNGLLQYKGVGEELNTELIDGFHEQIEIILREGVGALMDAVSATNRLISVGKNGCAKYSVLGIYLRRILLSFDKLTFAQVVELFGEFRNYNMVTPDSKNNEENAARWTPKEAEQLFAKEAARLLREDPAPLQHKITQLLHFNPDFAEAHFLTFLNCLRCKEFCGAKESLHQCFDRAMSTVDKSGIAAATPPGLSEERTFRYGTLNLAAMHVLFGHTEEAMLALKEVIHLSHAASDSVCLQHSMSWLYNTSAENREVLIHRAMARCSDLELGYLMSLAIQAFTKYSGQTGGRPSAVFDVIMKSDVLNCQHLLTELPANSFALKAALWSLYGQTNLASLYSQQLLYLRGTLQPPVCLAMCNIARFLADQGEYEHAIKILGEAQELFPRHEAWMVSYQEVHFAHLLCQSRFWEAAESATLLAPVRPRESALRKLWLSYLHGDKPGAMHQTQSILELCADRWFLDPEIPPLKVRVLMSAADSLPPGEALWCLLQALSLAQSFYLHYLAAVITMSIANVLLNLSLGQRALRLTEASLPYLMAHGGSQSRGRALILLARCRLTVLTNREDVLQTAATLTRAQDWLMKTQDYVRVKHCWYLKALIYHELGLEADRNKCAFEFRQLEEIYPSTSSLFVGF